MAFPKLAVAPKVARSSASNQRFLSSFESYFWEKLIFLVIDGDVRDSATMKKQHFLNLHNYVKLKQNRIFY